MNLIKKILMLTIVGLIAGGCGVYKPYNVPEFIEVNTSETAFVVPLEDDLNKQVKFDSEEAYKKLQVSLTKIKISKRWVQTGRDFGPRSNGKWEPTIRVIIVNRAPVNREWTADPASGTSTKNEAIWTESSDSVGFSVGFNCTAFISESDAAKFLYWYPSGSLDQVMDGEIRARVQQMVSEVSATYTMDTLRTKKNQIIEKVRNDCKPFFAQRGITITTLGLFGEFEYKNPQIQTAIDSVFIAQQEKNTERAKLEAMEDKQNRMTQEGIAQANRTREIAQGESDAKLLRMGAEAEGIKLVNNALKEAKNNPLFVEIKRLEVESERIAKWNGEVYKINMGSGGDNSGVVPFINLGDKKLLE